MQIILFDNLRERLLPLCFTRSVADLRIGILKIREKWERHTTSHVSVIVPEYLEHIYGKTFVTQDVVYVNGGLCPDKKILKEIEKLDYGYALCKGSNLLAFRLEKPVKSFEELHRILPSLKPQEIEHKNLTLINHYWDIFLHNRKQIIADFALVTMGRESETITDPHTRIYGEENIFVEKGAKIRAAILNAEDAPIYIGTNASIEEGAIIRGAFALCEGATVNTGAKMRGDTTIGRYSKVGGEVSNSVIMDYSNKAHEGFLGNSVIGEWCNLGADTNCSNLKNNYSVIKSWQYEVDAMEDSGQQFLGLIMGDHCKAGINTMFNTGTVLGIAANVFGGGFLPKHVPSFSWGNSTDGFETFSLNQFFATAQRMMQRRNCHLSEGQKQMLTDVFKMTHKYRFWEK